MGPKKRKIERRAKEPTEEEAFAIMTNQLRVYLGITKKVPFVGMSQEKKQEVGSRLNGLLRQVTNHTFKMNQKY